MITCIVIISCLLSFYMYLCIRKRRSKPFNTKEIPLEKGLPIIGVVNDIKGPLCEYLLKLSQKHGPIYQIRFGMRTVVVLNTFEYLKAALVEEGDVFSGRWHTENHIFVTHNAGLFFIDGHVWSEQRAFVLKTLREFGVGRSRSMEIVQEECAHMLEDLENLKDQKFDLTKFFFLYSLNVISKFVMNKRFTLDDPELNKLQNFISVTVTKHDPVSDFLLMFPFIERWEWVVKFIIWITSRQSLGDEFHRLIEKEIKRHLSRLDFNSEGDDLIDKFLIKQRRKKEETGEVGTFTNWQLIRNTFDLLMSGLDTSSLTLSWSFMFMAMYPDIQNKVHEEIMEQIGNERMPTMADKVSLVYTQAVMDEVLRLSSMAPLSVKHRVLNDVNLKGYFIPADTIIIPNQFACHLDPNVWEKPYEFYPEHFLLRDGNGELKYGPREEQIAFGMGKRVCLGESLARMEYFIFLIHILQKFQVNMVNRRFQFQLLAGTDGILRKPNVEEFIFTKRE